MNYKRNLYYLACVSLAVFGFVAWTYMIRTEPLRFGVNAVPETLDPTRILFGYAATLFGVALGALYRELQRRRTRGAVHLPSIRALFASAFRSIDFWISLCGSPIVYALLVKSVEGGSYAALATVAVQNGFCCSIIVDGVLKPNQKGANE
jgi:hypothetical protein